MYYGIKFSHTVTDLSRIYQQVHIITERFWNWNCPKCLGILKSSFHWNKGSKPNCWRTTPYHNPPSILQSDKYCSAANPDSNSYVWSVTPEKHFHGRTVQWRCALQRSIQHYAMHLVRKAQLHLIGHGDPLHGVLHGMGLQGWSVFTLI